MRRSDGRFWLVQDASFDVLDEALEEGRTTSNVVTLPSVDTAGASCGPWSSAPQGFKHP